MYSDNWNNDNYKKSKPLKLSRDVELFIWHFKDEIIGVSVNFEIANDVHYDIYYEEWLKFEDWVKFSNNKTLEEYFENIDWLSFQERLQQLEIQYDKIAYYDFD